MEFSSIAITVGWMKSLREGGHDHFIIVGSHSEICG
jgi:hypothetical protein